MTTPQITLESFAFTVPLTLEGAGLATEWAPLALSAVGKAAGVPGKAGGSWGYSSTKDPKGKVVVGLSVLGFKKNLVVVSYAAFDTKGALLAWSSDLNPPDMRRDARMNFRAGEYAKEVELTPELRKKLQAVAGVKKVKGKAAAGTPLPTGLAHKKSVRDVSASPDGRLLVSVGYDGALCIWDGETGAPQHRVHIGAPFLAACPCDDASVFVGTKSIRRFDLATGKATLTIDAHPRGEATDLALSPSGKYLATISGVRVVGADNTAALFDAKSGKRLGTFKLEPGNGEAVAFAPDEKTVYALTNEDRVVALSVPALKVVHEVKLDGGFQANDVAASSKEVFVARGSEVLVFDTQLRAKRSFEVGEAWRLHVSPDGKLLVVVNRNEGHLVLDAKTGKKLRTLERRDGDVEPWAAHFSPDGKRVVGSMGLCVMTWDVASGKRLLG